MAYTCKLVVTYRHILTVAGMRVLNRYDISAASVTYQCHTVIGLPEWSNEITAVLENYALLW